MALFIYDCHLNQLFHYGFQSGAFLLLLYFKFWDTCAECAGLLHRYTCAMVVCCTINPSSTLGISPNAIPPLVPYPPTDPIV